MGKLINIDNGGTLTDFCVQDGDRLRYTKTLTTPQDLSSCFFEGLRRIAEQCYGEPLVERLLEETDAIRYSTTQGTNSLVERKGPRLGLIIGRDDDLDAALAGHESRGLFDALVGARLVRIDDSAAFEDLDAAITVAVNTLTAAGANRIVVALAGADGAATERVIERIVMRRFPSHLLGAVPINCARAMTGDGDYARCLFTALFNSFLHPAMERFLYSAEHRLKRHRSRRPLLIFRNDGGSARVAKIVALKTYSSGPRGGMEGARALATHYGMDNVLTCDVGGTTTDVGRIVRGQVIEISRGLVEGVPVSFPLCHLHSAGVGGSSILRAEAGQVRVGPESVGASPGPACFGRGGTAATMTDVALLAGTIDAATYFGGELALDAGRAREAVEAAVGTPLKLTLETALAAMEAAWVARVAEGIRRVETPAADTVLFAFGGAGALLATRVADALGITDVLIPGLLAVFSAFGIGFSNLSQRYEVALTERSADGIATELDALEARARRDMFAEGIAIEDCTLTASLALVDDDGEQIHEYRAGQPLPEKITSASEVILRVVVTRDIRQIALTPPASGKQQAATPAGTRRVLLDGQWQVLPLYEVTQLQPGDTGSGPAIIEERYFTGRIDAGWHFAMTSNGDLRLKRG